jgi:TetR/AcrR family transcriptional regulator, transcriptional repressor of bet genes
MSRRGVEAERRDALVRAAIGAIEEAGSLEVTVAAIARRANVSSALAHHYFGGKEDLMIAVMRHLLALLREAVLERLREADTPEARLRAILSGCLDAGQFSRETVFAWLSFYLHARRSPEAARLLSIYFSRLESNLVAALRPLLGDRERALATARGIGAAVDGIWLRQALATDGGPDGAEAVANILRFVQGEIGR